MSNDATYQSLIRELLAGGEQVMRRGMNTIELPVKVTQWDMLKPIITIPERKINYAFMFAEAYWILTGCNQLSYLAPYCKWFAEGRFSDDGRTMSGAYGPRFITQRQYVIEALRKDLMTRQAVMTFWERNPRESLDIPCTISLQFFCRFEGSCPVLDLVAYMRSSDAYLGIPYDVFSFSMIAMHVALTLREYFPGTAVGMLALVATSQHIYQRDWEKCAGFMDSPNNREYHDIITHGLDTPDMLEVTLRSLRDNPNDIWLNKPQESPSSNTQSA